MTELQKRVSAIADRYNENARKLREYDAAIDGLMKTTVYSDEERRRQINEKTKARTEHLERSRTELAAAVKDAVEAERSAHTMQFQTAERETARANVLKMLEMAGNDLSPDQLQGLLAPFIEAGDRQSLDIFQTICRRTCPAAFDVS